MRQGCPLSPRPFNIYSEEIARHPAIKNAGFKAHGERIGSISYADNKILIGETPQQLQRMVSKLNTECKKLKLKININETKVMRINRNGGGRPLTTEIDGKNWNS